MSVSLHTKIIALMGVAVLVALFVPVKAKAEKGILSSLDTQSEPIVDIMLGKAEMVTTKSPIADVMVANPSVVDVMAVKANQLYVVGNKLGDTNLMILDEEGNVLKQINVHVQMDTAKLETMVHELYPNETVNIKALTDRLVITGNASTPAVSNGIANLVAQYAGQVRGNNTGDIDQLVTNMLTVSGEQQVMLKVKIVEASRAALKDLGLETEFSNGTLGNFGAALSSAAGLGLTAPAQLGVMALNYSTTGFGPLSFLARALEEEGIVNTLAEPNLTAISGEQAGFLAGGEVPIPTEIDRNGNLVYEFKPFGVSLNFRPVVMSENRISMEMSTEVSSASYDENLQLQGITIPTFNVRRADTTVELPSGGTLMIAGLLQSDSMSSLTSLPGVNKVPVVGDLLKSDSFQRNESELVVMVTPYLVKPFAKPQAVSSNAPLSTGDMNAIPRLSMDDLGELPSEDGAPVQTTDRGMAPPSGLSNQTMTQEGKSAVKDKPKTALSNAFEDNIKRTYNSPKANTMMKNMGNFGYLTD